MTRLKKELEKRSIIFSTDTTIVLNGIEYSNDVYNDASLVTITDKFIITVVYSVAIDPIIRIYDRFTFKLIGEQELYKDEQLFCTFNQWHSFIY